MKMPPPIHTRKIALANELGYQATDIIEDSFDDDGMTVVGAHPEHGTVLYEHNEIIKTRIHWPDACFARRATEARILDFEETIGAKLPDLLTRGGDTRAR